MDSITAGVILCIYLLIHFHLSNLRSLCIGGWMKLPSLNARCNDSSALPPRVTQAKKNGASLGPGIALWVVTLQGNLICLILTTLRGGLVTISSLQMWKIRHRG